VFKDVEMTDEDATRYSLILIGGPDANAIVRKLGGKMPVAVTSTAVTLGSRTFETPNARVQMVFPSPLNPERYMLVVAAGSAEGMYFWRPDRLRSADVDFTIEDDRVPGGTERLSPADLWVAGGWFNLRWQIEDALVFPGNSEKRAKAIVLRAPKPGQSITPTILDSYVGAYWIAPGVQVNVQRTDSGLIATAGQDPPVELVPVTGTEFIVVEGPVKIVFEKDSDGKVIGFKAWQNGREMSGRRVVE
jgi:hypothetical protein